LGPKKGINEAGFGLSNLMLKVCLKNTALTSYSGICEKYARRPQHGVKRAESPNLDIQYRCLDPKEGINEAGFGLVNLILEVCLKNTALTSYSVMCEKYARRPQHGVKRAESPNLDIQYRCLGPKEGINEAGFGLVNLILEICL